MSEPENKIPPRRTERKSLITSAKEKLRESLSGLREEISFKYVASVAGAVFICIIFIGAVLIFADPSVVQISKPNQSESETVSVAEEKRVNVKIREGLSTAEIADRLAEKGVINSSFKFRILARLRGYDDKLRPGAYTFTLDMSEEEVFAKLLTGEKKLIQFTVPEGFGVKEIAERLYNLDVANKDDFLQAAENCHILCHTVV